MSVRASRTSNTQSLTVNSSVTLFVFLSRAARTRVVRTGFLVHMYGHWPLLFACVASGCCGLSATLGGLIGSLGAFPVRRGEADLDAIRQSLDILKGGQKLLIFPEGTRVTEGKDVEAKAGAALLAARSGAPIVPVAIVNGRKYFTPTRVIFGDPIRVTGRREQQRLAAAQVMDEIGKLGCR